MNSLELEADDQRVQAVVERQQTDLTVDGLNLFGIHLVFVHDLLIVRLDWSTTGQVVDVVQVCEVCVRILPVYLSTVQQCPSHEYAR